MQEEQYKFRLPENHDFDIDDELDSENNDNVQDMCEQAEINHTAQPVTGEDCFVVEL